MPDWISLALLSAVFLGLYDIAKKLSVDKNDPLVVLLQGSLAGLTLMLLMGGATLLRVLPDDSPLRIVQMSTRSHLLVFAKAVLVSASWVCSYVAIRSLPLSFSVPIRASAPVFTVLGAIVFFGERLRPSHWAAICLIFLGYVGLSRVGRKEGIDWSKNSAVMLLVAGTLLGALSALYDKYLLGQLLLPATTLQFWFCAYNVAVQLICVGVMVLRHRLSWRKCLRPHRMAMVVGLLLVVADQFYFRALNQEGALIAVVSMTRRSGALVSFFFGGLLLKESYLREKTKMLCLVGAGVILLLF